MGLYPNLRPRISTIKPAPMMDKVILSPVAAIALSRSSDIKL